MGLPNELTNPGTEPGLEILIYYEGRAVARSRARALRAEGVSVDVREHGLLRHMLVDVELLERDRPPSPARRIPALVAEASDSELCLRFESPAQDVLRIIGPHLEGGGSQGP